MTTQSQFVTALVKEFGYPAWWFEVALETRSLGHKAKTWGEALHAYRSAPDDSIEKAGAYARYVRTHLVHESQWDEHNIRHHAYCMDFYERLDKTTHTSQVIEMLKESAVIPGSYLWEHAVKQLITLVRTRVPA